MRIAQVAYFKLAWLTNEIISFEIVVHHNKIISILQYDIMKSLLTRE